MLYITALYSSQETFWTLEDDIKYNVSSLTQSVVESQQEAGQSEL